MQRTRFALFLFALAAALLALPLTPVCAVEVGHLAPILKLFEGDPYLDMDHPAQDLRAQFLVYAANAKRARQILTVVVQRRHQAQQFFQTSVIWKDPAIILIYPSEKAYLRRTGLFGTGGAAAHGRLLEHGPKAKIVVTYEDDDMLGHTLPHELMHLLIYDMSNRRFLKGQRRDAVEVPVWVNEGIAEYMTANALRRSRFEKLVYYALAEEKLIPLERLLKQFRYDRRAMLQYAQSYSFIAFVAARVSNGRQRLRNYIIAYDEPGRAEDPMEIFRLTFQGVSPSIQVLERHWHAWIRARYAYRFPPVVTRTMPKHESTNAPTEGKIWVEFDAPIDRSSVSASTSALRKGKSDAVGDDAGNLLRNASLRWNKRGTVLLIEVPGGFEAGTTYTFTLSDHVKDTGAQGLTDEKYAEVKSDDFWKDPEEKAKSDKGDTEKEKKPAPPEVVATVQFKTKGGTAGHE